MPLTNGPQGWGEPIAAWDYAAPVANVDFANLGGYREVRVWVDGVTTDTASTDALGIQLSNDNGASFLTSGYSNAGSPTTMCFTGASAVAAAVGTGMDCSILDINSSTRKPKYNALCGQIGVSSTNRLNWGTRAAGPYNAVRVFAQTGANINGGLIRVYGKR